MTVPPALTRSSDANLVSVCMPVYNGGPYLKLALERILQQTYTNLELIVCDNGSTDDTVATVKAMMATESRIRILENRRNLGYAGNLHKVLALASGRFMMTHCADDFLELDAVQILVDALTESNDPDRSMAISDTYITTSDGIPNGVYEKRVGGFDLNHTPLSEYVPTGEARRFQGKEALAWVLPRLRITGWLGSTLYGRTLFEEIEGVYNGLMYSPDLQLNYHLLNRDPEVVWINRPLAYWRLHDAGQIAQAKSDAIPKYAWDGYTYTFHFPELMLKELGIEREEISKTFIDELCLKKCLQEIRMGNYAFGFRHLCIALATYPRLAVSNPKFYLGMIGILTGPVGKLLARLGYQARVFRS